MSEARTGFDAGRMPGRAGSGKASALFAASVFADRSYVRAEMAEDVAATGCRLAAASGLDAPLQADHSDILLVDCPLPDDASRIDLERLAIRAAARSAQLVVSTSMAALDSVFASLPGGLPGSGAQILVMPSRAERVIALARALPQVGSRVRELSDEDRLALLRLTEQVGQIAQKLEALSAVPGPTESQPAAFRFEEAGQVPRGDDATERLVRTARPPLPDPRLVRRIIRQRQLRARFFEGDLFADPAWDMLLDLTAARAEHVRVSVTSLCIASGVPPTTALRWISQMTDAGLLQRAEDEADRRRAFVTLTDKAAEAVARYFAELGPLATTLV